MAGSLTPTPLPVRRAARTVSEHIQDWRKLRGITQQQLAERAGVARSTVIRLEKGATAAVEFEGVLRVLHALGVLDQLPEALDPYRTDLGRMRAGEQLPQRVRPRDLS